VEDANLAVVLSAAAPPSPTSPLPPSPLAKPRQDAADLRWESTCVGHGRSLYNTVIRIPKRCRG
jgi:hypothetical protein